MMGYTSQTAGDEDQLRRGSRVPFGNEIHISGDSSATLWGHWSNQGLLQSRYTAYYPLPIWQGGDIKVPWLGIKPRAI